MTLFCSFLLLVFRVKEVIFCFSLFPPLKQDQLNNRQQTTVYELFTDKHRKEWVPQTVNNLPAMQETQVQSLGWEDPLEEEKATHSSILTREFHGQRSLADYSP